MQLAQRISNLSQKWVPDLVFVHKPIQNLKRFKKSLLTDFTPKTMAYSKDKAHATHPRQSWGGKNGQLKWVL